MLDLLQQDPKLFLTQIQKQLAHHVIWVSERMVQLWMYEKVASVFVLTNVAGNQWDDSKDSPYDPVIKSILVQCLTSLTDDVMFVSCYKLSIAFDNFGKQGKVATQKGRKKVKRGTFIGAFLAVSAKGFVYYQKTLDFTNSYKYSHILGKLFKSWDSLKSLHWVFLSNQMEGSSTALEVIQGCGHQASFYPAGHINIHLGDAVFFNMEDTLQEHRPQVFNDLYLGVLNHKSLFGCQMMADLFAQMVLNVNMGNQLQNNKCHPCATAVTVSSIMPGIIQQSRKAQKIRKPFKKLTDLTDLNQTVD
ncbi:hypothetical protein DSO57_1006682 [Entomophthora muscae]|uniref:Uncharacterized protein n=1 Tax=Entomophthora muscae TaxID=34485 RepID=A0ACC2TIB5_9FUNG|nr:hypothetical protein DSO57_1006682 [Entomophthora muscae]